MLKNSHQVPLPIAIWLATDEYDHSHIHSEISATTLLKSPRYIINTLRNTYPELWEKTSLMNDIVPSEVDVQDKSYSRIGTAIHTSVEDSITNHYMSAMEKLGYPKSVIDRVRINPTEPKENSIDIYLEQRLKRDIENFTVTGKFDVVVDGELHDIKTTSTYSWTSGCNDEYYRMQGSIYRWLNPELITSDYVTINFVFTNWTEHQTKISSDYPPSKIASKRYALMSLEETEAFIRNKLKTIKRFWDSPLSHIPCCTEKELFNKPSIFKYYQSGYREGARSTKNFDNLLSATKYKGIKKTGDIIEFKGEPRMCPCCDPEEVKKMSEIIHRQSIKIV